jgi:hypothetical protein
MRLQLDRSALRALACAATGLLASAPWTAHAAGDDLGPGFAAAELPWAMRAASMQARLLRSDDRSPVAPLPWMADALPTVESPPLMLHGLPRRADWRLSLHWPLTGGWSFGLVPGVAVDADVYGRRFPGGTLAAVLGRSWSSRWRTFVDVAGDRLAVARGSGEPLSLDAGLAFIASPTVQLDFALTRGLVAPASALSAGAGIVAKF